jgi:hypothetical protein
MAMSDNEKKAFSVAITAIILALGALVAFLNKPDSGPSVPPIVTDSTPHDSTPPVVIDSTPASSFPNINGATLAELPRTKVDVAYPAIIRHYIVPANLQAAYDTAKCGDEILLVPGTTYNGNLILKDRPCQGWIVIRTNLPDSILGLGRMTPSRAAALRIAKIIQTNNTTVISTQALAHHIRIVGVEVSGGPDVNMLIMTGVNGETNVSNFPHHIIFDRDYVHGNPSDQVRRCFRLEGSNVAIIHSWVSECHNSSTDSQAILGMNGPLTALIEDNYLDAGHEVVMFGGGDPSVKGLSPSDITIRRNHATRPASWKKGSGAQYTWTVKSIFEIKNGERILYEYNVVENMWSDAQVGFAWVLKMENQDNTEPQTRSQNITVRYNITRNSGGGFNLAANPTGKPGIPTNRYLIHDNLLYGLNQGVFTGQATIWQFLGGMHDIVVVHNTATMTNGQSTISIDGSYPKDTLSKFAFSSNVYSNGAYGVHGPGTVGSVQTFKLAGPNSQFSYNIAIGGDCNPVYMHPTNKCPPSNTAAGLDSTWSIRDTTMTLPSHDGRPIGADIAKILAGTRGVVVQP